MKMDFSLRGAIVVGDLADLPPTEAEAVRCLRGWRDGGAARSQLAERFEAALGRSGGEHAANTLAAICEHCRRHGRRPMTGRRPGSARLCADEACFADLVALAGAGQREDAFLMATMLVRPDMAPCLVSLAETLALTLRRIALRTGAPAAARPLH